MARGLGLENAHGPAVQEEQVVGVAIALGELELAHRDALGLSVVVVWTLQDTAS
jgi:hypothetical protein